MSRAAVDDAGSQNSTKQNPLLRPKKVNRNGFAMIIENQEGPAFDVSIVSERKNTYRIVIACYTGKKFTSSVDSL